MRLAPVLLILLLAPLALAQLPSQGDAVTVSADRESVEVRATEPASFTLTVTRGGQSSGPFDAFLGADVTILMTGTPTGWTASADPNGFVLAPGESRDVTIRITAPPGTSINEATLTMTAQLVTRDPISGAVLGSGEDSAEVILQRADGLTRDVLETIGPGIWVVIAVAVAALIVAGYLLIDGRSTSVRLQAPTGEIQILPGTNASVPFMVRNTSGKEDRFILSSSCSDDAWSADLPIWQIELGAGEEEELLVAVAAPKKAKAGSRVVVRIVAVPDQNPDRVGTMGLSVLVQAEDG